MKICVIGSGNVATHFTKALYQSNNLIVSIYSQHIENARALAEQVNCDRPTNQLSQLPSADLYLFAIKDKALHDIAQALYQTNSDSRQGLWVHTAGSMPLHTFPTEVRKGVIYPLMTLGKTCPIDLHKLPLFVYSESQEILPIITKIAQQISPYLTTINEEQRQALHIAAIFANNFSNHCYTIAFRILEQANINPECLFPIIDETSRKIHNIHPLQAQTGPAIRWDENVIEKHLKLLQDNPEVQSIYELISQSIHHFQQPSNKHNND